MSFKPYSPSPFPPEPPVRRLSGLRPGGEVGALLGREAAAGRSLLAAGQHRGASLGEGEKLVGVEDVENVEGETISNEGEKGTLSSDIIPKHA